MWGRPPCGAEFVLKIMLMPALVVVASRCLGSSDDTGATETCPSPCKDAAGGSVCAGESGQIGGVACVCTDGGQWECPTPPACSSGCSGVCIDDACCRPAVASGDFTLPAHAAWTYWTLPAQQGLSTVEYRVRIHNDPGTQVGLYLSPLTGSIDGADFYFGMQTTLNRPGVGGTGKGFIFSSWGTFDEADLRTAPGGFTELGTHEGVFAGLRLNADWHVGTYMLRLVRGEGDANGDWFDFTVLDVAAAQETWIGAIRFRRSSPALPATIHAWGPTFVEVYSGATDYAEVPRWHIELDAAADAQAAIGARSEYPAFPEAEFPNADVWYDSVSGTVHMTYGGDTARCHPAGVLF